MPTKQPRNSPYGIPSLSELVPVTSVAEALQVVAIRNTCAQFMTRDQRIISEPEQAAWWNGLDHSSHWLYRLCVKEHMIGYGMIRFLPDPMLTGAISEEWRGKGQGQRLFQLLLDELREMGHKEAHLEVRRDNGRAIALYVKLGFVPAASEDVIKMSRQL